MTANGTSVMVATASWHGQHEWTQHGPIPWAQFVSLLELDKPADRRDCGGYVGGELRETKGCSRSGPDCVALHRKKEAVVSRSVLALDADKATQSLVEDAKAALGSALVCHTTWRHTPEVPRWRLLAPLSRPVTPDEYRKLVLALITTLGGEQFDVGSAQPERLMYKPSTQGPYEHHVVDGPPLDVDTWLERAESLGIAVSTADRPEPCDEAAEGTEGALDTYTATVRARELARLVDCELLGVFGPYWNNTTYAVACNLIELANSPWNSYTLEAAHRDLIEHAPTDEGFGARDHEDRWQSAAKKVGGRGRPNPHGDPADDFAEVLTEDEQPHGTVLSRFPRMSLAVLLDSARPEREYVVEPMIAAGTSTALVAPAGHRKSLLSLRMALAVARGENDFAGMTIPRPRRVLYVDMENIGDDLRERLLSFGVTPAEDLDRFVLLSLPTMRPLDTSKGGSEFLEVVQAYGLVRGDVVVLDSYQRITEAGENDSDTTRGFYRHTGVRLKQLGLTVVRTDNTGKDISRGARGSSGKRDDVDVEYLMQSEGDYIEITAGKARLRGVSRLSLHVSTDEEGRTTFRSDVATSLARKVAACRETLDGLGLPLDTGERKAQEALKDAGAAFPRVVLREAIAQRKGRAEDFENG